MDIAGWEDLYSRGERGREEQATALLAETAEGLEPGRAIDLACGTGRNALYLARRGWIVEALDGSTTAVDTLRERARSESLQVEARVADLHAPDFELPEGKYDLAIIAFYLQRDLFGKAKGSVKPSGRVLAIAHISEPGEAPGEKRANPGELREYFADWEILWEYEGPSRDPAHRRPVAEIVARRPAAIR